MYREQVARTFFTDEAALSDDDRVLIVIPCLNERAHIEQLIADTLANTASLDRLIVVADGGSTDGTMQLVADIAAREPHVALLYNPKKIQSAGVNLAVRAFGAGRHWLVRLDAHADYSQAYVPTLIAEARRSRASSVVVAMRSEGSDGFQAAAALVQNSLLGAGGSPHRRTGKAGFVDHGHHALFDLKRFAAIGGYDENLSHNEDAEFDLRLTRSGDRIWLTRAVDIVYFPRASIAQLYRQYVQYGRGRAITLLRHRKFPKLRQLLPLGVAPAVALVLLTPWFALAALPAVSWAMLCLAIGALLGIRQNVTAALYAGTAAMTMHFAWSVGFWREVLKRSAPQATGTFPMLIGADDATS